MRMTSPNRLSLFLASALLTVSVYATEKIMFLGDSITYQGNYVVRLAEGIKQSALYKNAQIVNVGVPSENTSGLTEDGHAGGAFPRPGVEERLSRVLTAFKPDIVIICYGTNDGLGLPQDPLRFATYRRGMSKLKSAIEATGAKPIFLEPTLHEGGTYNGVLDDYATWLETRRALGWIVVRHRQAVTDVVKARRVTKPNFRITTDGVHPSGEGHTLMAQAIWPGLRTALGITDVPATLPELTHAAYRKAESGYARERNQWLIKTGHGRPQIHGYNAKYTKMPPPPAVTRSDTWSGCKRDHFNILGNPAFYVHPKTPAPGKPWIWRTEFFGHRPEADKALLAAGWGVAYVRMSDLYGNPKSLHIMDKMYDTVVARFGAAPRVVLEGFSRGGMYAFNWAVANPDQTLAIYADAPVCDFKSWPRTRAATWNGWENLKKCYGFKTEAEALAYPYNAVDTAKYLAQAGIPLIGVVGEVDDVVPVKDNYNKVEAAYLAEKGPIKTIRKPNCNHHPHSLDDPTPIVDFLNAALAERGIDVTK